MWGHSLRFDVHYHFFPRSLGGGCRHDNRLIIFLVPMQIINQHQLRGGEGKMRLWTVLSIQSEELFVAGVDPCGEAEGVG